jgi:hypothetical protein
MSARKETSVFIDDRSLEWLSETYYQHYDGEPAVGEASAGTLGNPAVAERIADAIPEVQFVFLLRDPVERLYSHFNFLRGVHAIGEDTSFSVFIRSDLDWRDTLVDLGRYHKHLARFEHYFDRTQMLVLLFDDLKADTEALVQRVYRFVGVDPSFRPDLSARNQTREPRFRHLHRLLTRAWEAVREQIGIYAANQTRPVRRAVKRLLTQDADPDPLSPEDEAYLCDIYREPNRRLEEWLDRDLSHWR